MRKSIRTFLAALSAIATAAVLIGCAVQAEDLSYTDPEWRQRVNRDISFPLPEPLTISVGSDGTPDLANPSRSWLERKTNIVLEYVSIPSSPGDVELGSMIRAGNLPDIISEQRLGSLLLYDSRLFADLVEFPELTPNFDALLRSSPEFLAGVSSRVTLEGNLFSPGTYDPAAVPFAGSIHFRQDLFESMGLRYGTWDELLESLRMLKRRFPDSYPFGIASDFLHYSAPSWFGSGLDRKNVLYYDASDREWKAGPLDPGFRRYVEFFRTLYAEELIHPDMLTTKDDLTLGWFMSETIFAAPSLRSSGPLYSGFFDDYGGLTPEGEWDGTGKWISSMPIPAVSEGVRGTASPELWTAVGSGWCVYNQSGHVGEAIALLDFMFTEEAGLVAEYGPEGILWTVGEDGRRRLVPEIKTPYNPDGARTIQEYLRAGPVSVGFPLAGLLFDDRTLLGTDLTPGYRHFVNHDAPSSPLTAHPGITFGGAPDFLENTADIRVSLDTEITSAVAQFIIGRRPLDEYDAFVAGLDRYGLTKLQEIYRENTSTIGLEKLSARTGSR